MGGSQSALGSNSGIRSAASSRDNLTDLVVELKQGLGHGQFQHILAFFSGDYDIEQLSGALSFAFPDTAI